MSERAGDKAPTALDTTSSMSTNETQPNESGGVECPECDYCGSSSRSVATHWGHKHEGPCPVTNERKVCENCNEGFWAGKAELQHRELDYCSRDCWKESVACDLTATCECCEEDFEVETTHNAENQRFCSVECYYESMRGVRERWSITQCANCDLGFEHEACVKRQFCSPECHDEWRSEGKTKLKRKWRGMEKSRGWVNRVFNRDDYTCQECGQVGVYLNAHHITPLSTLAKDVDSKEDIRNHPKFNNIENGLTLCEACHADVH